MQKDTANLATLIGARICHDLISPVGAISNGLELLTLTGETHIGPEFELISNSCTSATARIRFFRVAFGTSSDTQKLGRNEIVSILSNISQGARLRTEWRPDGDQNRREVQLAFLLHLCFETALPQGGTVVFNRQGDSWHIEGTAPRIKMDPEVWQLLTDPTYKTEIAPSRVQFLMLQSLLQDLKRNLKISQKEGVLSVDLSP